MVALPRYPLPLSLSLPSVLILVAALPFPSLMQPSNRAADKWKNCIVVFGGGFEKANPDFLTTKGIYFFFFADHMLIGSGQVYSSFLKLP